MLAVQTKRMELAMAWECYLLATPENCKGCKRNSYGAGETLGSWPGAIAPEPAFWSSFSHARLIQK